MQQIGRYIIKCEGVAQLRVVGGGRVWVRPDPKERCTRIPDSGSGHTPPRGKAKGAGGLDSKYGGLY
jgi:hypothetical protein